MIRVQNPIKIVGDRHTNTNLRYKQGKNLNWDTTNKMMVCRKPENIFLPKPNESIKELIVKLFFVLLALFLTCCLNLVFASTLSNNNAKPQSSSELSNQSLQNALAASV
ncbi:MAG: hypothetical protein RL234_1474, partial [Pseudomonadota bacterium]